MSKWQNVPPPPSFRWKSVKDLMILVHTHKSGELCVFVLQLVPPVGMLNNPMNAVTTKFVRTSTNKVKCPVFVIRVRSYSLTSCQVDPVLMCLLLRLLNAALMCALPVSCLCPVDSWRSTSGHRSLEWRVHSVERAHVQLWDHSAGKRSPIYPRPLNIQNM